MVCVGTKMKVPVGNKIYPGYYSFDNRYGVHLVISWTF